VILNYFQFSRIVSYILQDRADGIVEAQLYIPQVRQDSFRKYTLVVENPVASKESTVELIQRM